MMEEAQTALASIRERGAGATAADRLDLGVQQLGHVLELGVVGGGPRAVLQPRVGELIALLGEPGPRPGGATAAQVLEALGAPRLGQAAEIVEHLQPGAEAGAQRAQRLDHRGRRAGGDRRQLRRHRHQRRRLAAGHRRDHRGDARGLEVEHPHRQVERLALVAVEQGLHREAVHRAAGARVDVDPGELLERPEVQPVAGVDRQRHAGDDVQRRTAAPDRGVVLDVVDDERPGVQRLDRQRDRRGDRPAAARELPGDRREAPAQLLAGAAEVVDQRAGQGAVPQRGRHVGRQRGLVDRHGQRRRGVAEVGHGGGHVSGHVSSLARGAGAPPNTARHDRPRGGRPTNSRARSPRVSASA